MTSLELCIDGIKTYGKNIRRVIVVSKEKYTGKAEWIAESQFPFTKADVVMQLMHQDLNKAKKYITHPGSRSGWLLQQLIKLYSPFVIQGISENVLVLDSDTIFLRPVAFISDKGWPLFNVGSECNPPYFLHAARLLPGLKKVFQNYSGITHHMLLQKHVLQELFRQVETLHNCQFWEAFIGLITPDQYFESGASEYEIYFNYFVTRSDQYSIRELKWKEGNINQLLKDVLSDYDYVTYHERILY